MILHLIYNLCGLFINTNVSKYFISSQNNALLIVIIIGAWLVSTALFVSEAARVYRMKAAKVADGEENSSVPKIKRQELFGEIKSAFVYTPTLVCAIVTLALYIAVTLIGFFA